MHVEEAKRRLGSSITCLADTMENVYHDTVGQTPNSEFVIDPDGVIVARRAWSDPRELRRDLERFVGPVENPTTIAELDMPIQPPPPTVAKGIVDRVERPTGMLPIEIEAMVESSNVPFYVKIRAEGDSGVLADGNGTMYRLIADPEEVYVTDTMSNPLEFKNLMRNDFVAVDCIVQGDVLTVDLIFLYSVRKIE